MVRAMSKVTCACGREHGDGAALSKRGWQSDGAGGAIELANCPCSSTITISELADACLCVECHRLIVGDSDDVKVATPTGVHCRACARRSQYAIPAPIVRRVALGGSR
jgi:hypothetical protein